MQGAPAGVSQDLQQFTQFRPSQNREGICMNTCVAVAEILKETATATGTALSFSGGDLGISCQLNMTDPARLTTAGAKAAVDFITPVFDLIASAFVRYKVKKLIFHYEPQAAATDGQRLVFAFANDPLHPILWNATVPTSDGLLALSDSIAFMPWRAWSMDVSHKLADTEFFTFSDASTTVTEFVERFSDFGVMSCITSEDTAAANLTGGVLYIETEIEFSEFCPISVTRPASLLKVAKKVTKHAKKTTSASGRPVEQGSTSQGSTISSIVPESEVERLRREIEEMKM